MEFDLGGIVAHVDDGRLIVDRADEEVTLGLDVVEQLLRGAGGPHFVVEVLPYRTTLSFGTPGVGVGRVTYQLGPLPERQARIGPASDLRIHDATPPTVTLKRID